MLVQVAWTARNLQEQVAQTAGSSDCGWNLQAQVVWTAELIGAGSSDYGWNLQVQVALPKPSLTEGGLNPDGKRLPY